VKAIKDTRRVKVGGTIERIKVVYTKKDQKPMAFVTIQDDADEIDLVVFPTLYEKKGKALLEEGKNIIAIGKLNFRDGNQTVICDDIIEVDEERLKEKKTENSIKIQKSFVKIELPPETPITKMKELNKVLLENCGHSSVIIVIPTGDKTREVLLKRGIHFTASLSKKIIEIEPRIKISVI